jgi:integrase
MSVVKRPGSSLWWADIFHNGERIRQSLGTEDRQEAQRLHDELKARLWKTAPKLKGKTWGMAVDLWCDAAERSDSELLSLRKFAEHYPDRLLTKVTGESIEAALNAFCKTAGTYTRYRTMIRAILNVAREKGWLRELPKVTTKKSKTKPRDWITHEQWNKLYAELPKHMKPMAAFAVATGLRQANVLALTWDRVDIERRIVWVEAEDTKGDAAIAVPLSDEAVVVFAQVLGVHSTHVFTFRGRPIKDIKTAWIAACIRAGLGHYEGTSYRGFTWHGLRHTWATWHVQNGTPLDVLQKLGGWSDLRMVMNYSHHSPGYLAGFANNTRKK